MQSLGCHETFFRCKKMFFKYIAKGAHMQINPISPAIATQTDQTNKNNCDQQPTDIEITTSRIIQSILNKESDNCYQGKWHHLVFSRADA